MANDGLSGRRGVDEGAGERHVGAGRVESDELGQRQVGRVGQQEALRLGRVGLVQHRAQAAQQRRVGRQIGVVQPRGHVADAEAGHAALQPKAQRVVQLLQHDFVRQVQVGPVGAKHSQIILTT